jgi:rhodanese-related sulfurtransferase
MQPEGAIMVTQIDRNAVQSMFGRGAQLVDVLPAKEYEAEHIPGAINIPLKSLGRETARQLESDRPVIVYCHDYQ